MVLCTTIIIASFLSSLTYKDNARYEYTKENTYYRTKLGQAKKRNWEKREE